jgi:hypothetical protein
VRAGYERLLAARRVGFQQIPDGWLYWLTTVVFDECSAARAASDVRSTVTRRGTRSPMHSSSRCLRRTCGGWRRLSGCSHRA